MTWDSRRARALLILVVALSLGSSVVRAQGELKGPRRGAVHRRFVDREINLALDAARASPAQRAAAHAARERVAASLQAQRTDCQQQFDRLTGLFLADEVDTSALTSLRREHAARMRPVTDTMVAVMQELHDAFTPAQRQAMAAHLRARWQERSSARSAFTHGRRADQWVARFDEAMATLDLAPAQRQSLEGARDHLRTVLAENHRLAADQRQRALDVFLADSWNQTAVTGLRAERDAALGRLGDALVQAFVTAHGVLTPLQRARLVEWSMRQQPCRGQGQP